MEYAPPLVPPIQVHPILNEFDGLSTKSIEPFLLGE